MIAIFLFLTFFNIYIIPYLFIDYIDFFTISYLIPFINFIHKCKETKRKLIINIDETVDEPQNEQNITFDFNYNIIFQNFLNNIMFYNFLFALNDTFSDNLFEIKNNYKIEKEQNNYELKIYWLSENRCKIFLKRLIETTETDEINICIFSIDDKEIESIITIPRKDSDIQIFEHKTRFTIFKEEIETKSQISKEDNIDDYNYYNGDLINDLTDDDEVTEDELDEVTEDEIDDDDEQIKNREIFEIIDSNLKEKETDNTSEINSDTIIVENVE